MGEEIKLRVDGLPEVKYGSYLKSDERLSGFGNTHNWQRELSY